MLILISSFFQKLAYLLPFPLEMSRYALVAKALRCEMAFSTTSESEDSLAVEKIGQFLRELKVKVDNLKSIA